MLLGGKVSWGLLSSWEKLPGFTHFVKKFIELQEFVGFGRRAHPERAGMRSLRLAGLWQAVGWVYVFVVISFSLSPSPPDLLTEFQGADKLIHLSVYGIMMLWFGCIYLPGPRLVHFAVAFILLGIALDLVQGATDYRTMELLDMVSNACGVCLGGLLAKTRVGSALVWLEARLYGGRGGHTKESLGD